MLPEIDWSKHVAIAVSGSVLKDLGDYSLSYVGANNNSTAVRLTKPIAQTMGNPQYENRYAIWVLPKPKGQLVVETPQYGLIGQPVKWLEQHVIKSR
jgi:hypothetical protein